MSACEKNRALISMLIDGELTAAEEEAVRLHIASCPDCKAMYDAFCALRTAVSEAETEVPETLHAGIMSRVNAAGKAMKTHGKLMHLRRGLISAACLVFVFGTVFALTRSSPKMADSAVPAQGVMMLAAAAAENGVTEDCAEAEEVMAAEEPAAAGAVLRCESAPVQFSQKAVAADGMEESADEYYEISVRVTETTERGFSGEILACRDAAAEAFTPGACVEVIPEDGETTDCYAPGDEVTVGFSSYTAEDGICVTAETIS